jgi:monofunctional biosynthetic peptidoglycan transglycosylase
MARRKTKSRTAKGKPRKKSWLQRGLRLAFLLLLGFVILSFALVLPLRWLNPVTTAFMLQDDAEGPLQHEWVAWEDIGLAPKLAVVAAEDQRFADHFGIDMSAIQKAVTEKDERGALRGASTISQQTAKNLYLWSGRSFVRKGLEAWLTVLVEICLPKQRILEIYLNIAEFGPGIYGVGAAGREYFGRTPAGISFEQAALLAAVLPNPVRMSVNNPSEYVRERQRWIITQMRRLQREGWITRIE